MPSLHPNSLAHPGNNSSQAKDLSGAGASIRRVGGVSSTGPATPQGPSLEASSVGKPQTSTPHSATIDAARPPPPPLSLEDSGPFTKAANPGPAHAAYVEEAVMPFVAPALAKLLADCPANPVQALATQLRDAMAEARRRPAGSRRGGAEPALGAVATQHVPVLLDSDDGPALLGRTLNTATVAEPAAADATVAAHRAFLELELVSRPAPLTGGRPYPARFARSGPYPVFGMDLPTAKELSLVVRYILSETGAEAIHWVVAGLGDVQLFHGGRPYRATPTPQQWQALRNRVDAAETISEPVTRRRSAYSVKNGPALHAALEDECVKSVQQSIKAFQLAEARRAGRRVVVDASDISPNNGGGGRDGGGPTDAVLLSVSAAEERAQTPVSPMKRRYEGLGAKSVVSVASAIAAACTDIRNVAHSFTRLQHPDDAVAPTLVYEEIAKLCDARVDREKRCAIVIIGTDRWPLIRHLQSLVTLYYVVEGQLQALKRMINASDSAGGAPQQTFARDVGRLVAQRRKARDDRREWLVKAHVAGLYGEGGGSGGQVASEAASLLEKRTHIKLQRNQRRRKADLHRADIDQQQMAHAAGRIGRAVKSFIARRRQEEEEALLNDDALFLRRGGGGGGRAVPGGRGGPKATGAGGAEKWAIERRVRLAARYSDGEYPLIGKLTDALYQTFGLEYFTSLPPQTSSASKSFRRWVVTMRRVDPVDELDVSSEEEEWADGMAERVHESVRTSSNPLHDALLALRLSNSPDLSVMQEIFTDCPGLASLQRKGMHALERLGALVQFAAFLSLHHKRRLGAALGITAAGAAGTTNGGGSPSAATTPGIGGSPATVSSSVPSVTASPQMAQLVRIPPRIQAAGPTYRDFLRCNHVGQTLLEHGCWVTPFLTAQPSLLHRPSSTRLLIGAATPTGGFLPHEPLPPNVAEAAAQGAARASRGDVVQQISPKAPLFLVPDHLHIDQWVDAVAATLKRSVGTRRVLWLSMRPEATVYVNEVPLYMTSRPELTAHDASLPAFTAVMTANVNDTNPPVYLEHQSPLSVPGPADAALAAKREAASSGGVHHAGSGGGGTAGLHHRQSHLSAVSGGSKPASRRGSLGGKLSTLPSNSNNNNARDLVLRSPTPGLAEPHVVSEQGSVVADGGGAARVGYGGRGNTVRDHLPLPTAVLGVNIDSLERDLCSELIAALDAADDGKLTIHTCDAFVAGEGVPVACVNTILPDRPSATKPPHPLSRQQALRPPTPPAARLAPSTTTHHAITDAPPLPLTSHTSDLMLPPPAGLLASRAAAAAPGGASRSNAASAAALATGSATPSASPLAIRVIDAAASPAATSLIDASSGQASPVGARGADGMLLLAPVEQRPLKEVEEPERVDAEVVLQAHPIQVLRPKAKAANVTPRTAALKAQSFGGDGGESPGTAAVSPNRNKSAPFNLENAGGGLPPGADATSDVSTAAGPSFFVKATSDRTSIARSMAARSDGRRTVRGVQGLRRQPSIASAASEGQVADEDESLLRLPLRASEAVLTPWQAADEVRLRLKRRYALDNAITFRRSPFFRTTGGEWLKAIDQLYQVAHTQFGDPYLAVAFGVSDEDSVFSALACTIVWAVEHGKAAMLGVPESNLPPAAGSGWDGNGTTSGAFDASMFASGGPSNLLDFSGATTEPRQHSPFGSVQRLVDENGKAEMLESLKFVDVLLQQTNLRTSVVTPIEYYMHLAEAEAARLAAVTTAPTLPERQRLLWYAQKASQALERYILLILFHHFARFVQEQRQVMSVMQVDFSFGEHIASLQGVESLLSDLDPWEGRAEVSPLSPFSIAMTPEMRWRRRRWVATIG